MKGWHKNEQKQFFQTRDDMVEFANEEAPEVEGALISQGAEGKVFLSRFLGRAAVTKERLKKNYRVAVLDQKINRSRLLQEARCISKCKQIGVAAPHVYMVDSIRHRICMERIEGLTFKAILRRDIAALESTGQERSYNDYHKLLAARIGQAIARIHACDMIHGDLTTSNLMIRDTDPNEVAVIDFGLGSNQAVPEDKAVDLYVLERSFLASHPGSQELVDIIMSAYHDLYASNDSTAASIEISNTIDSTSSSPTEVSSNPNGRSFKTVVKPTKRKRERTVSEIKADNYDKCVNVLKRLESVRMRGRKRDMFG